MSVTINPSISVEPLADVEPGSLVQVGKLRGFCALTSLRAAQSSRVVVLYDEKQGKFHYQPTVDLPVLNFGQKLIITPEIESIDERLMAHSGTTELFIDGTVPKIVFRVEERGPSSMRCLNLDTGMFENALPAGVAFKTWSVEVATASGKLLRMMDVMPHMGGALDDEGSLESD